MTEGEGQEKEQEEEEEEKKPVILMECSLTYSLADKTGQETAKGDAQARLDKENLNVLPKFGEAMLIPLRDTLDISEGDYKIQVVLTSNEKLVLSNLGYRYEDFLRNLVKLRNEVLLKDMLMYETLKKSGAQSEFAYFGENGEKSHGGKCEPRLYETGLVIMPDREEPIRIHYSDISEIREEGYALALTTEFGEKIAFSKMGSQYDSFKKTLSDAINELTLKVQLSLKELLPKADPLVIRKASRFMKEGKAARRSDIESVSPELWTEMEKKLEDVGMKEEYEFLKSLGQKEKICIGLKRGLLGDMTGEYIWFLIPIYSTNPTGPGNAVAMEATRGEGGGRATYFFRIVSRKEYPNLKNLEDLHTETDNFIRRINRCMLAVNFRREPIYLSDEALEEPQYVKYRFAVLKMPQLQVLRSLFIGRIFHISPEQWKNDVLELLKFNISTQDDNAKWGKYLI